jgi:50S ribosomal subunit-associated GTPase HflX
VLAGLVSAKDDVAHHVAQAAALIHAAGATVVATVIQRRGVSRAPRPGGARALDRPLSADTFVGAGKAAEIAHACVTHAADLVVFLNELSAAQRARLAALAAVPVVTCGELRPAL